MRLLCTMLMSFTFSQVSWFQVSYFVELNRSMNYILCGDVGNFARILGLSKNFRVKCVEILKKIIGDFTDIFPLVLIWTVHVSCTAYYYVRTRSCNTGELCVVFVC